MYSMCASDPETCSEEPTLIFHSEYFGVLNVEIGKEMGKLRILTVYEVSGCYFIENCRVYVQILEMMNISFNKFVTLEFSGSSYHCLYKLVKYYRLSVQCLHI